MSFPNKGTKFFPLFKSSKEASCYYTYSWILIISILWNSIQLFKKMRTMVIVGLTKTAGKIQYTLTINQEQLVSTFRDILLQRIIEKRMHKVLLLAEILSCYQLSSSYFLEPFTGPCQNNQLITTRILNTIAKVQTLYTRKFDINHS